MEEIYAIEMLGISKRFGNILANDHIDIRLKKGHILALCGENGAGKSTIMSILFGLYEPDEGVIKKEGEVVKINNPNDATKLNIGMVHQHFKLVDTFTVLQNIILGEETLREYTNNLNIFKKSFNFLNKHLFKLIDYKKARSEIIEIINKYDLHVDLDKKIKDISVEMQQKVEIIKMLYRHNDILIFDEPTAVLTEQEIQDFLKILKNLKKEGKSIIFISHKLNEVFSVSDEITVIRKGKYIDTLLTKDTSKEEISALMVGRKVDLNSKKHQKSIGEEVLRVEHLTIIDPISKKKVVNDVSFNVRKGEIVTLAGIDGNGQQEVIYGITGIKKTSGGLILLNGKDISKFSIRERMKSGISHIPEDRHKYGLVLDYTIYENSILDRYYEKPFSKYFFLHDKEIKKYTDHLINKYDIRSSNEGNTITRSMSGGNQQKIIVGREIEREQDLLIAVQPTRGLDIGAIEGIHHLILEQRDKDKAILLVSLELDQVLTLSDRILVMYEGEIVGEFKPLHVNRETLGLYMSGAKKAIVNAIKEGNDE
ncbi:MAG: ABC transporter ATP-binding protein [Bacilli bacterium]|nr:ABC transporter ATP-binding protein [Bacilli bacterium]